MKANRGQMERGLGAPAGHAFFLLHGPDESGSRGLARRLIHAVRQRVEEAGLTALVAPVRPSMKSRHPDISIDEYTGWRDDGGRHYDSWMRSHESCGGQLIGACHRSMVVDEPLGFSPCGDVPQQIRIDQ